MKGLIPIALIGFVPVALIIFALMPKQRALICIYVAGWLFLPVGGYALPGLPDYNKITAVNLAAILAIVLLDTRQLFRYKPHWLDLPVIALAVAPAFSSLTNGLGAYDALSSLYRQAIVWAVPYFVGRLYFTDSLSIRQFLMGIFVGGLVYVPLCLLEMLIAPVLHLNVYGQLTREYGFMHVHRWGGWRPNVFLETGLMLGLWMSNATICGFVIWRSKSMARWLGFSPLALFLVLAITTIFCKSSYATALGLTGIAVVFLMQRHRIVWPALAMLATAPTYIFLRLSGLLESKTVIDLASSLFSPERTHSLAARLEQEDVFSAHTMPRFWFGWGGWGRGFPIDPFTEKPLTRGVDGYWTIAFSSNGIFGLSALFLTLLLPAALIFWRLSRRRSIQASDVYLGTAALIVTVYALDCLLNAMFNPIYALLVGGLSAVLIAPQLAPSPAPGLDIAPTPSLRPRSPRIARPSSTVSTGRRSARLPRGSA